MEGVSRERRRRQIVRPDQEVGRAGEIHGRQIVRDIFSQLEGRSSQKSPEKSKAM